MWQQVSDGLLSAPTQWTPYAWIQLDLPPCVQVRCNPAYYGIPRQVLQSVEALDRWVKEKLLLATIQELAKHGMVGRWLAAQTAACP